MRLKLISTRFEFEIDGIPYSTVWRDNPEKDRKQKYEVEIYRGGGLKGVFYTNQFINKSNSAGLLKEYLNRDEVKRKTDFKSFV